jgi:hypothetical protein
MTDKRKRKKLLCKNRVRTLMITRNVPVSWVSEVSGIPNAKIRLWIKNEAQPNPAELYFLSLIFKCSMEDLIHKKIFN